MREQAARIYHLDGIARETLLLAAEPRLKPVDKLPRPRVDVSEGWHDLDPIRRPIWEYEWSGLDQVKDVAVRNRLANGAPATVCQRISWGLVRVRSKRGNAYELPLTDEFLLRSYFLEDGEIDGTDGLWPLPANLHNSAQRLFGYQVDLVNGRLVPIPKKALDNPALMYPSNSEFTPRTVRNGDELVRVPLHFIVCITLGCATEREDFEPSGSLGAARLWPMTLFLSNRDLEAVETDIVVERPLQAAYCHMDGEEMTRNLGAAFFTDRNAPLQVPAPYWSRFFDYYSTSVRPGEELKVVQAGKPQGLHPDAVEALIEEFEQSPIATVDQEHSTYGYSPRAIHKVEGQGEFDNIHIAPKMVAPSDVINRYPAFALSLREIVMAPFCIHDCLHTHWRWGNEQSKKGQLGWSGTAEEIGVPYKRIAAPLVPPNQDVTIRLLSSSGFRYTATIKNPKAAVWQPVFHHGSAYAVALGLSGRGLTRLIQVSDPNFLGDRATRSWALFYWLLRYKPVGNSAVERIRLTDEQVRQLRAL